MTKRTHALLETAPELPTRIQIKGASDEPLSLGRTLCQNVAAVGRTDDTAVGDAARLVACWNACEQAGLSNDFLVSGGIGRMRDLLVDCRAFIAGLVAALPTATPVRESVVRRLAHIDALLSEMSPGTSED